MPMPDMTWPDSRFWSPDDRPPVPFLSLRDRILDVRHFAHAVHSVCKKHYAPSCCIAAVRLLCNGLTDLRFRVTPLKVVARINNEVLLRLREERGHFPQSEAESDEWAALGAKQVVLGEGDPQPGKWPGHLVALVENRLLLDVTLHQANRPAHGIVLDRPYMGIVLEGFADGLAKHADHTKGCVIVWEPDPDDTSFVIAPDWQFPDKTRNQLHEAKEAFQLRRKRPGRGPQDETVVGS